LFVAAAAAIRLELELRVGRGWNKPERERKKRVLHYQNPNLNDDAIPVLRL
jgi:hypothetical protein